MHYSPSYAGTAAKCGQWMSSWLKVTQTVALEMYGCTDMWVGVTRLELQLPPNNQPKELKVHLMLLWGPTL